MASRWLLDVAPQRGLYIHWRSFSLTLLNGCADVPRQWRARAEGAHDVLRVVEAARAAGQPQAAIRWPAPASTRGWPTPSPTRRGTR